MRNTLSSILNTNNRQNNRNSVQQTNNRRVNQSNTFLINRRPLRRQRSNQNINNNMQAMFAQRRIRNQRSRHAYMRSIYQTREQRRLNNLFDYHRQRDNTTNDDQITDMDRNEIIEPSRNPMLVIPLESGLDPDARTVDMNDDYDFDNNEMFIDTILNDDDVTTRLNFRDEDSGYITTFITDRYTIRYNHDVLLSPMDSEGIYNNILFNMQEQQRREAFIMNPGEYHNPGNENDVIERIHSQVKNCDYCEGRRQCMVKNDTCPICMEDFEDSHKISIFTLCNHAIHNDHLDQYTKLFKKCPLCNEKLFV